MVLTSVFVRILATILATVLIRRKKGFTIRVYNEKIVFLLVRISCLEYELIEGNMNINNAT